LNKLHQKAVPAVAEVIPAVLYRKIKAFLDERKSGQIVLYASDGRIQSYQFTEHGKIAGARYERVETPAETGQPARDGGVDKPPRM
jgi:hypothetical protein